MGRPNWDQYFLNIAQGVASRATCPRGTVGAVIVRDNRILSTGYNGALPGESHCTDVGCLMVNNHCERTIHAETNAVAQAAKFGTSLDGATLYLWSNTDIPVCTKCSQVMQTAGIVKRVVRVSGVAYESKP